MSDNKTLAERVRIFFAYGGPIDILSDKGRSLIEEIAALEAEVVRLRAAAEKGAAAERERILEALRAEAKRLEDYIPMASDHYRGIADFIQNLPAGAQTSPDGQGE